MTEEEKEQILDERRKDLEREIRYQEMGIYDAQAMVAQEVGKLRDLQQRLMWLHTEDVD